MPDPDVGAARKPACRGDGSRLRVPRLVTDVLAPANLLIALLMFVGWRSTGGLRGIAWGLVAAAVCAGLPLTIVLLGVWRRRWTDIHLGLRRQRPAPILIAVAINIAAVAVLAAMGAPREVLALILATICGLTVGLAITLWWKISGHTAVAGAAAVVVVALCGPWLAAVFLVLPLVGWARVAVGDHTPAQVTVGGLLGVAVTCAVFLPSR
jgi:membrane-associated phospholipid phosphatase